MIKKMVMIALLGAVTAFAGEIQTLDDRNFDKETQTGMVLVDFYATWCGPCKRLGPVLELVADEMGQQVMIYKVDIDQSPDIAKQYNVKGVPTLLVMKDGEVRGRLVGFHDKSAIKAFIHSGGRAP